MREQFGVALETEVKLIAQTAAPTCCCPADGPRMPDYFVHESSYVDDGAVIGAGTKIWHFCHVMPGAVIGERCNLGQNVVVMPRHPDREQREGPEQRVDLRGRDARGRRVLRPELRLHQRDQPAEPRVAEGGVPADAGPAGGHDRGQRHDRLRGAPSGSTRSSGPGRWSRGDVPAYALMVGVPARRDRLDVPVRGAAGAGRRARRVRRLRGSTYREDRGRARRD